MTQRFTVWAVKYDGLAKDPPSGLTKVRTTVLLSPVDRRSSGAQLVSMSMRHPEFAALAVGDEVELTVARVPAP